ncbi:MAG: hypothetical protein J6P07_01365, partial [Spirochaetaceae bacterium]|nr:hypothetical protein [Spirochaetaceae bacterium]
QIAIKEAKKQAMLDIHNSVLNQEKFIKQSANDEYKARCEAIDAEPLRNGETDSKGKILPAVQQLRKERKLEIRKEIEAKALEDLAAIQGKTTAQEDSLFNDIQNDLAKLRVRRTISSIEDARILDIGNYAGDKYEWDTTVSLYINDVKIFGQNANIAYSNVSGKNPVTPSAGNTNNWNDYLDTVDLYDYMFRRKVPAVTLEVDYSIDAMPDNYPSMYKMSLYEFRFIDTITGKVVQTITPAKSSYRFSVNPTVDISYYKGAVASSSKTYDGFSEDNTQTKTVVSQEGIKTGKEVKKRKNIDPIYDQTKNGGARFNLGFNIGRAIFEEYMDDTDSGIQLEGYCSIPLTTFMFMQMDYSWLSIPDKVGIERNLPSELAFVSFDIGINFRPRIPGKPINIYMFGGAGPAYSDHERYKNSDALFGYKGTVGIDIPMEDFWCFTVEGGVLGLDDIDPAPYAKIGVAFTIPNFTFWD